MIFLTTQPLWITALILLVPTTALAMLGPAIVRHYVPLKRLRNNNEVAGFKFATVGVVYAVLLAFVIIVVWERFNHAEVTVAKEASAAATVLRLTQGVEPAHGAAIRAATIDYLKTAIAKDWPAMEHGKASREGGGAMSALYAATVGTRNWDVREGVVVAEILRNVDQISEARRLRLLTAHGIVPGVIWVVLFTGAFLTVGFTFFFGTENLHAQSLMSGALAILVFSGILTITVIDRPFAGPVKVGPEALASIVEDFGG